MASKSNQLVKSGATKKHGFLKLENTNSQDRIQCGKNPTYCMRGGKVIFVTVNICCKALFLIFSFNPYIWINFSTSWIYLNKHLRQKCIFGPTSKQCLASQRTFDLLAPCCPNNLVMISSQVHH